MGSGSLGTRLGSGSLGTRLGSGSLGTRLGSGSLGTRQGSGSLGTRLGSRSLGTSSFIPTQHYFIPLVLLPSVLHTRKKKAPQWSLGTRLGSGNEA